MGPRYSPGHEGTRAPCREQQLDHRSYVPSDYQETAELWRRINRELAPPDMVEIFDDYIESILNGELRRISEVFTSNNRSAFWVVTNDKAIVGCFGIEHVNESQAELRRMYLDLDYRGRGIANWMLTLAEHEAIAFGYTTMILSTAEIQHAALAFYRKAGYQLVRQEHAGSMSNKTVGSGLKRYHFAKTLVP